jgi:hypothetical protein
MFPEYQCQGAGCGQIQGPPPPPPGFGGDNGKGDNGEVDNGDEDIGDDNDGDDDAVNGGSGDGSSGDGISSTGDCVVGSDGRNRCSGSSSSGPFGGGLTSPNRQCPPGQQASTHKGKCVKSATTS